MDDRKFEDLMNEYVKMHVQDKDRILGKLRARQAAEKPAKKEKTVYSKRVWAWSACACALIVVIALSVFLPLYLTKNPSDVPTDFTPVTPPVEVPDDKYYASSSDLFDISVDSAEELFAAFGREVPLLKMEYENVYYEKTVNRNDGDRILGVCISYDIYNDTTDFIEINAYPMNVELESFIYYENLRRSFTVKGTEITYADDSSGGGYAYRIAFEYDNLNFHIRVTGIEEIDLQEIIENLI